jgi:hypothetical protein
MEKTDNMPMWVFFGLSSIKTRKGGMLLFWSCVLSGILFLPWITLFPGMTFIPKSLRLEDWSWAGITFACAIWYWFCVRWVDKNASWESTS